MGKNFKFGKISQKLVFFSLMLEAAPVSPEVPVLTIWMPQHHGQSQADSVL